MSYLLFVYIYSFADVKDHLGKRIIVFRHVRILTILFFVTKFYLAVEERWK